MASQIQNDHYLVMIKVIGAARSHMHHDTEGTKENLAKVLKEYDESLMKQMGR